MEELQRKSVWVIMTKCRKFIAKGTPRNRSLVSINDEKCNKRYLTYSHKGKAESAFKVSGFSTYKLKYFPYKVGYGSDLSEFLEAVECEIIISIK